MPLDDNQGVDISEYVQLVLRSGLRLRDEQEQDPLLHSFTNSSIFKKDLYKIQPIQYITNDTVLSDLVSENKKSLEKISYSQDILNLNLFSDKKEISPYIIRELQNQIQNSQHIEPDLIREERSIDDLLRRPIPEYHIPIRSLTEELSEYPFNYFKTEPFDFTESQKRRVQVAAKFWDVPNCISDEEIELLLHPDVTEDAGKWYVFLRSHGKQFEFPQSMNGQFSAMMHDAAITFGRENYDLQSNMSPSEMWNVIQMKLSDGATRCLIRAKDGQQPQKEYPLGKVYESISLNGLKEKLDPLHATNMLVYGLIGQQHEKVQQAFAAFEKEKLEHARDAIAGSHVTREQIFRDIAPSLTVMQTGNPKSALAILNYFEEQLRSEEISDLVAGVKALFSEDIHYSHLDFKVQDGVYEDMFGNHDFMACTFLPNGLYKEASVAYHNDPNVGLLHVRPRVYDTLHKPVGVAITCQAHDTNGQNWLVVDSVEGGRELERVQTRLWVPALYRSVRQLAQDVNAQQVLFNSSVFNSRPKLVLDYVSKLHSHHEVGLEKTGMKNFEQLGVSKFANRGAFETWGKLGRSGRATGYVVDVTQ